VLKQRWSKVAAVCATALVVVATFVVTTGSSSSAQVGDTIVIDGRGWGHGRGMSQWGALGYAVDHGWNHQQILGHYYSNTTVGNIGDPPVAVQLTALTGQEVLICREAGGAVLSGGISATAQAIRAVPEGGGWRVAYASGLSACDQVPAASTGTLAGSTITIGNPTPGAASSGELLGVRQPDGEWRWYRGSLVLENDGTGKLRNEVSMEVYLRGVVSQEMSGSWAELGGGRGIEALRAQAVAARSYAAASSTLCDTTACQVYRGAVRWLPGSPTRSSTEHPEVVRAIAETAGEVRLLNGAVARTEYSSSTGGQSAGGTFPSVTDEGDDYLANPNHSWRVELRRSSVESVYPSIGQLLVIDVTQRDGNGVYGGRARQVVLRGTAGAVTLTGDQFRSAFAGAANCASGANGSGCIRSTYFRVGGFDVDPAATVATASGGRYWLATAGGSVFPYGGATYHGSMSGTRMNGPVLDMAATPSGSGYWLVGSDGGIFAFGDAGFFGSTGAMRLNQPVVGMTSTPDGGGYWLVAADGGIFAFGVAQFYGSTGAMRLNQPVVGMESSGAGYWLVASDGGIFAYGDAQFFGSTGNIVLNQPIVDMARTASGNGYWLVAADGGIFAFGDAQFFGSAGGTGVSAPIVGMAATASGNGYRLVGSDGRVYSYGDAA
jgi:SpoIID/LytB domain protein